MKSALSTILGACLARFNDFPYNKNKYEDGVLKIVLPKKEAKLTTAKQISVK